MIGLHWLSLAVMKSMKPQLLYPLWHSSQHWGDNLVTCPQAAWTQSRVWNPRCKPWKRPKWYFWASHQPAQWISNIQVGGFPPAAGEQPRLMHESLSCGPCSIRISSIVLRTAASAPWPNSAWGMTGPAQGNAHRRGAFAAGCSSQPPVHPRYTNTLDTLALGGQQEPWEAL